MYFLLASRRAIKFSKKQQKYKIISMKTCYKKAMGERGRTIKLSRGGGDVNFKKKPEGGGLDVFAFREQGT